MARVAILLRGINVGGHNRIAMADLRAALEGLGCADISTYLQSGNAVVTADEAGLADRVQQALRNQLGLDVAVLTRTAAELDAVVAANPFDPDATLLHAVFLSAPVGPGLFDGAELGADRAAVGDRVLYVRYASGSRDSAVTRWLTRSRLPGVTTARNWRTMLALQELARQ